MTAVFVLMPVSLSTLHYLVTHRDPAFTDWLFAFLYMAAGLLIAQRIVVSASGMSYREFLINVKRRLFTRE